MNNKVYWAGIEYIYSPESPDFNKIKGGFVYAFVNSKNRSTALSMIKKELESIQLIPIEFEYIKLYRKDTQWQTTEEANKYLELFLEAQKCNQVLFDTFYAYENE